MGKNEQKDNALRNMSKYLLQGAEMLTESCPNCDVPLLVDKEENYIFCANCGQKFEFGTDQSHIQNSANKSEKNKILISVEQILFGKLEQVMNQIAGKNSDDLKNDLETLKQILNVLKKIKDF